MKKPQFKNLIYFSAALIIIITSIVFISQKQKNSIYRFANAGAGDNVHGWAWSENIGWISFDCMDPVCVSTATLQATSTDTYGAYVTCREVDTCTPADGVECRTSCNVCDNDDTVLCTANPECGSGTCVPNDYGVTVNQDSGDFSGYAWSPYVGWISFNRATCYGGTTPGIFCAGDPDCAGGGTCVSDHKVCSNNPAQACVSSADCGGNNCDLSGATGNPPQGDPGGGSGPIAQHGVTSPEVNGWAKILSMEDDGWIRFDHGAASSTTISPISMEFSGWAWNSSDGVGWISTNCQDTVCVNSATHRSTSTDSFGNLASCAASTCDGAPGVECRDQCSSCSQNGKYLCEGDGDCNGGACNVGTGYCNLIPDMPCASDADCGGVCVDNNFLVKGEVNGAPGISFTYMEDPGYCDDDMDCTAGQCACASNCEKQPQLTWHFEDAGGQTAYQVVFHDSNIDPGTAAENTSGTLPLKTEEINGNANSFFPHTYVKNINYDHSYYFWVRVWDMYDVASAWVQYNDPGDTDGDGDNLTFTTYKHEFPVVGDIVWIPKEVSEGERIRFYDFSKYFTDLSPDTAIDCDNDSTVCAWAWDSINADFVDDDKSTSTPILIFNSINNQQVELTVTDNENYSCRRQFGVNVNIKLPTWQETK